jgi:hypothetical protein
MPHSTGNSPTVSSLHETTLLLCHILLVIVLQCHPYMKLPSYNATFYWSINGPTELSIQETTFLIIPLSTGSRTLSSLQETTPLRLQLSTEVVMVLVNHLYKRPQLLLKCIFTSQGEDAYNATFYCSIKILLNQSATRDHPLHSYHRCYFTGLYKGTIILLLLLLDCRLIIRGHCRCYSTDF